MSKILQATVKNLDTASLGKGNHFLTENLIFQHIYLPQDLHFFIGYFNGAMAFCLG